MHDTDLRILPLNRGGGKYPYFGKIPNYFTFFSYEAFPNPHIYDKISEWNFRHLDYSWKHLRVYIDIQPM